MRRTSQGNGVSKLDANFVRSYTENAISIELVVSGVIVGFRETETVLSEGAIMRIVRHQTANTVILAFLCIGLTATLAAIVYFVYFFQLD